MVQIQLLFFLFDLQVKLFRISNQYKAVGSNKKVKYNKPEMEVRMLSTDEDHQGKM